ncbi:hypothetical protein DYADSP32_195, partial [Dyadobacter sp. 32]
CLILPYLRSYCLAKPVQTARFRTYAARQLPE